jgi:DNA helicase-2/ATP-dependent DNA helicase PcrA
VLAYVQLSYNHKNNVACKRIINVPKRGVGKATVDKISAYAVEHSMSFYDACMHAEELKLGTKVTEAIKTFVKQIELLTKCLNQPPQEFLNKIMSTTLYLNTISDERDRVENVEELIYTASSFDTVEEFLENVALISDTDTLDESNAVKLMTVHAAKGLEFDCVFIAGAEEGLFPHQISKEDYDIEEERRLFYVAMTRARLLLYITSVQLRFLHGMSNKATPSRFIKEIPDEFKE